VRLRYHIEYLPSTMSRRHHSTRINGWHTRRLRKGDVSNEDEVNGDETPVRLNNPLYRNLVSLVTRSSTRSIPEGNLPGAYEISRRPFRQSDPDDWDTTEQETSYPTTSPIPTDTPHETLEDTTIIDAHVFAITNPNDVTTPPSISESTRNVSSMSQLLCYIQQSWCLLIGMIALVTIVLVVLVLIFLTKREPISQPPASRVEENLTSCKSTISQDPFYQCRCYQQIIITDEEVRNIYTTQPDTIFLYYGHNETTISVTDNNITSCDPDNIARVWLAIDTVQAQENNEGISPSSEMLIPRWALCRFYATFRGEWWYVKKHWLQHNVPICHWYGIQCDSETGKVTSLSLPNNNITGNLGRKPILSMLSDLRILNLNENALTGSLPMDVMNHKNLGTMIFRGIAIFFESTSRKSNNSYFLSF
jgi:hypothetical protein